MGTPLYGNPHKNLGITESPRMFRTSWIITGSAGQDIIRPLWRHYFLGTHAMIFVVDSGSVDVRTHPGRCGFSLEMNTWGCGKQNMWLWCLQTHGKPFLGIATETRTTMEKRAETLFGDLGRSSMWAYLRNPKSGPNHTGKIRMSSPKLLWVL